MLFHTSFLHTSKENFHVYLFLYILLEHSHINHIKRFVSFFDPLPSLRQHLIWGHPEMLLKFQQLTTPPLFDDIICECSLILVIKYINVSRHTDIHTHTHLYICTNAKNTKSYTSKVTR